MRRIFALLPLSLVLACAGSRTPAAVEPPTLTPTSSAIPAPEIGLPFHSAAIVDLALIPPGPGERWRLVSGDLDGWVRFWADGKLLAAWPAHPGGLAGLVRANDGTVYTAGFDGRVREWPAGATQPSRSFAYGRQVTALAVSDQHLALSDGRFVELWTRGLGGGPDGPGPERVWTTRAHAFVTGLTLSAGGGVIAAAELRESGIRDAIATHPLAVPQAGGVRAIDPAQLAELRYLAERDFPGAAADFVEVWQPSEGRSRQLVPQSPIDADLAIFGRGGVVYREIFDRGHAALYGRRLEDRAHVSLTLVKPWALFSGQSETGTDVEQGGPSEPMVNVGDFVLGPNGEIIVVDHFPGWDEPPPAFGWRVGERRELAIASGFAAIGDGLGNLAVVELAQPTEPGWQAPGEERPELLAAAGGSPWLATATLEPRAQYRLWAPLEAAHQAIRVEPATAALGEGEAGKFGVEAGPLYPLSLDLDDAHATVAISAASFDAREVAAVRLLATATGEARLLSATAKPFAIELALAPDAGALLAWTPGYPSFAWTGPDWTPAEAPLPAGAPVMSANGRYAAYVSALERTIVERESGASLVVAKVDPVVSEVGDAIPAALSNAGTLALVEPFGGGVVQLLGRDGAQASVELPGAATALAWVDDREGQPVLIVGFEDGSIIRVDPEAGSGIVEATTPIHADQGGRIWTLAPLGGQPGVFVELDEQGLALHRLDDDAIVELHLADAGTLGRDTSSPPAQASAAGLVAVWRPGTAMPACAVLDASLAGVQIADPAALRRVDPAEGPALFRAFAAGEPCPQQPPVAPIEPLPFADPGPARP